MNHDVENFLNFFNKQVDRNDNVGQALLNLLTAFKTSLPDMSDMESFHKTFRTNDLFTLPAPFLSSGVQNAMWYLLNEYDFFWQCLEQFNHEKNFKN